MTKLLRVLILTILGAMLPTTAGLAQDVTTDILENAQNYSDRWVTVSYTHLTLPTICSV